MKKILPFIHQRFKLNHVNINKEGIERILRNLAEKNLIVEGSKLLREEILDNEARNKIYEFIREKPGSYFNTILEGLDLPNHVLVWHLEMLLKFEFIRKEVYKNREIYFDSETEFKEAKKQYLTLNKKSQEIISFLKENNNGYTKTDISNKLSMHPYTINKYIKPLVDHKILFKKKKGRRVLYFYNDLSNLN